MSISVILGEILFAAHKARRGLILGTPAAMAVGILVMIIRNCLIITDCRLFTRMSVYGKSLFSKLPLQHWRRLGG